uniref:Methyltransferase domain-containing protein n=1 Tax=Ciona savignyi TaxID=51511 RepID=H2Z5Q3_CIOSA
QHPGICNLRTVSLPGTFVNVAKEIFQQQDLNVIKNVAVDLSNYLVSRRTPENRSLGKRRKTSRKLLTNSHEKVDALEALGNGEEIEIQNTNARNRENQNAYWKQIVYDHQNSHAFLLARSPGCYASSFRVLSNLKHEDFSFTPKSMLDFGSGTGTSMWAANKLWKESLKQYVCVDSSEHMNRLSHTLHTTADTESDLPPGIFIRKFLPCLKMTYDLVISSYTLSEQPSLKERMILLKLLWEKTSDYLVIIEHGNFNGYQIIMEARNLLVNNATVVAPCPHDGPCPMWGSKTSCIFSQTYNVPSFAKMGTASESFSYVVLKKNSSVENTQRTHSWPRVVGGPNEQKSCVDCSVCTTDGVLENLHITKKIHGTNLKSMVKKCHRGDYIPF